MRNSNLEWRRSVVVSIVVSYMSLLLAPGFPPRAAWGQTATPADPVAAARDHYSYARFEEAIALLQPLVEGKQLQGMKLLEAKEVLARSYVKLGNTDSGKNWFKELLRQDRTWEPDPNLVPPDELDVFKMARAELEAETRVTPPSTPPPTPLPGPPPKPVWKKWWLWTAVGVATGVVVYLLTRDGDGDEDLPLPPPPPSR